MRTGFAAIELVRFLLARIDDEEQALRKLVRRTHRVGDTDQELAFVHARVDIVGRRQLIGHVQHLLVLRDLPSEQVVRDLARDILRSMAGPYVDHLQYRDAWDAAPKQ